MPTSDYLGDLRKKVGHDLLVMPSVTIITFDSQNRVLLVKHADKGLWVAPGGSIEPNETPADAAVREMWEETGRFVELTGILGVYGGPEFLVTYANGDQTTYVMIVFRASVLDNNPRVRDVDEILEIAYFGEDELQALNTAPWLKIVLNDAFADQKGVHFKPPTWRPLT